jgi:hypothetical protein
VDYTTTLRHLYLDKNKFKRYLMSRYSQRVATKFANMFEFTPHMDYKYFFKQFMEIILNHAHTTKEMIENAQQFSF